MADSGEKKSGFRWGLALALVAPMGLWRTTREAAQSVRDTFTSSKRTLQEIGREPSSMLRDWNSTVSVLGVTQARIEREVFRRQCMAVIAGCFVLVGIYGVFAWSALLPGIGCSSLASLYYFTSALRLHQIRHREFISIKGYIGRVIREPRELMPIGLPSGWKLFKGNP